MTRKKPYMYKRFIAYFIDLLAIALIAGSLAVIFNVSKKADKDTEKIFQVYEKYANKEITREEFVEEYNNTNYELTINSKEVTIITIAVTIIYYVIMCYFCHGITLGKYIMKIRIVSANERKLNILNYLLRSLIINSILSNLVSLILVSTLSKDSYISISSKISNGFTIIMVISFIFMMYRDDGRGLHDLISNTKVIDLKKDKKEETEKIEEATIVSEEKEKGSEKKNERINRTGNSKKRKTK